MMPPAHRLFVDPMDLFAGPGWLWCLPPLVFAAALVYHTLRCGDDVAWAAVARRAAWLSLKVLGVFAVLTGLLWLT